MREGTIFALLYACMWVVLFMNLFRHYKKYPTSLFVVSFYLLYSILAVFLYNNPSFSDNFEDVTFFPYLYLFIAISLSLLPIFKFDKSSVTGLIRPSQSIVNAFTFTFVLFAIISIPTALLQLREGIVLLIVDPSGGAALYKEAHGNGMADKGLADIPTYFISIFSYISVFFFYYYLTLPKLRRIALLGLSITMIYNLLRPISLGLRTETVMTLFAFVAGFVIMQRWIQNKRKKKLIRIGACIGGIVLGLMIILTISRFTMSKGGVTGNNLDYIAQSSLNFNNYGLDAGGIRYGDRTCRVFKEFLGFADVPDGIIDRRNKYSSMKMNDSIFYTFVGDFTLDFGPIIAMILFIIYSLFISKITKVYKNTISFSKLLIVYLVVLIPLQGGMYLFTFSDGGNYSLLAFAFTAVIFSLPRCRNSGKIQWTYK